MSKRGETGEQDRGNLSLEKRKIGKMPVSRKNSTELKDKNH